MPNRASASSGAPYVDRELQADTQGAECQGGHAGDERGRAQRLEDAHGAQPEEHHAGRDGIDERVAEGLGQPGGLAEDRGHGSHVGRQGGREGHHQQAEDEPQQPAPPAAREDPEAHELDELERLAGPQQDLHEHEVDEASPAVGEEQDDEEPGKPDALGEEGHGHDARPHARPDHHEGRAQRRQGGGLVGHPRGHQRVATST